MCINRIHSGPKSTLDRSLEAFWVFLVWEAGPRGGMVYRVRSKWVLQVYRLWSGEVTAISLFRSAPCATVEDRN